MMCSWACWNVLPAKSAGSESSWASAGLDAAGGAADDLRSRLALSEMVIFFGCSLVSRVGGAEEAVASSS